MSQEVFVESEEPQLRLPWALGDDPVLLPHPREQDPERAGEHGQIHLLERTAREESREFWQEDRTLSRVPSVVRLGGRTVRVTGVPGTFYHQ